MGASQKTVGNKGGKVILSTSAAGTTNSGVQMAEARGFKNWMFCLAGTFTGFSVTIYGTIDPNALTDGRVANPNYPVPGAPGGNWFALNPGPQATAPADVQNPLTANTQNCPFPQLLVAVCAVAVGSTPTGTVNVLAFASE